MKRSRCTEEQIIRILKQHQAGLGANELCRKHGVSDATFYKKRSKYGGMEVSDARKLKALKKENRKLKKLLAETALLWLRQCAEQRTEMPTSTLHKNSIVCTKKSGKLPICVQSLHRGRGARVRGLLAMRFN
jgi:putative transposase